MSLIARVPPSSDLESWHQVFVQKQYKPLIKYLPEEPTILDLGANAGFASAYFEQEIPSACILAVELDPENYSILTSNVTCDTINAGVWSKECRLDICRDFRDGKEWSFYAKEGGLIEGHTIDWFKDYMKWEKIDLIKMDIEGGEAEVFKNPKFLDYTGCVAMELHDEKADRNKIEDILTGHGFSLETSGELLIGVKQW